MFKGKMGTKSKRSSGSPGEGAVVSSAPVEVDPNANPSPPSGATKSAGTSEASDATGGRFKGMFKRASSGKSKKASPAKGQGSSSRASSGVDEVELSHQVDQMGLSHEPGSGASSTPYSQHLQQPVGLSGVLLPLL